MIITFFPFVQIETIIYTTESSNTKEEDKPPPKPSQSFKANQLSQEKNATITKTKTRKNEKLHHLETRYINKVISLGQPMMILLLCFNSFVLGTNHQSFKVLVPYGQNEVSTVAKVHKQKFFPEQKQKYKTSPIIENTKKRKTDTREKNTTDLTSNPVSIDKRFVEVSYRFLSFMFRAKPNESKLSALPIPRKQKFKNEIAYCYQKLQSTVFMISCKDQNDTTEGRNIQMNQEWGMNNTWSA